MSQLYFEKFSAELQEIKNVRNRIARITRFEQKITELLEYTGDILSPEKVKALRRHQALMRKEIEDAKPTFPRRERRTKSPPVAARPRSSSSSSERSLVEADRKDKKAATRAQKKQAYKPQKQFRNNKRPVFHRC